MRLFARLRNVAMKTARRSRSGSQNALQTLLYCSHTAHVQ
jgi:hypothetical protein